MLLRSLPRTTGRYVLVCVASVAVIGASQPPAAAAATAAEPAGDDASTPSATTTTGPTNGERGAAEASVASLQVERSAVRSQLAAANQARQQQFDEWSLRHLAAGTAAIEAQAASEALDAARAAVAVAEERVKEYAREAYINPPPLQNQAVLSISDADDMSWAHDVLGITADDQRRVMSELEVARDGAARAAEVAREAADEASAKEAAEKSKLAELDAAVARQEELASQVEYRLDSALAEVAALEAIDRRAAEKLEKAETELAAEVRGTVGESGSTSSPSSSSPGTTAAKPTTPARPAPRTTAPPSTSAPRSSSSPPSGTITWSDVVKVRGFWVNKSIASSVAAMVDAASAAGIPLSGGGFRDPASQITLREAHCGPTHYDIYEKPASQCTPPTAVPGRSMHERGLALDLKYNGSLITSRSNPGFQWLAANAARYGFYNLPSEPWHWSTNGN